MTHPDSTSAETPQVAIPADTDPASTPPNFHSHPAPRGGAVAGVRQEAIQSLENLASSDRPLSELLEEAKQLVGAINPNPNVTARGKSEIDETPPLADIQQEKRGGRPNERAITATRFHRSRRFTGIWRPARVQILAAIMAALVGCAFGYLVAENDRAMQLFFSPTVGLGLFLVFSGFARRTKRLRQP
jgi:hypothetical protein